MRHALRCHKSGRPVQDIVDSSSERLYTEAGQRGIQSTRIRVGKERATQTIIKLGERRRSVYMHMVVHGKEGASQQANNNLISHTVLSVTVTARKATGWKVEGGRCRSRAWGIGEWETGKEPKQEVAIVYKSPQYAYEVLHQEGGTTNYVTPHSQTIAASTRYYLQNGTEGAAQ